MILQNFANGMIQIKVNKTLILTKQLKKTESDSEDCRK